MSYEKVSIFGVGLIGGAIGMDLKKRKLARNVTGWGRNPEHLKQARKKKACDTVTTDMREALSGAQIIILATPPEIIKTQMSFIKPQLKKGMLIMDVGSIKAPLIKVARKEKIYKTGAEFLGCHPMAGSEKTGVENAYEGMFNESPCIITPDDNNTSRGISKGKKFWEELGARVLMLDPDEHDLMVGFISHLPHAVSSSLVTSCLKKFRKGNALREMSGPSFREMTRIAGSSPRLWTQIFLENKTNVLLALENFEETIAQFKELLRKGETRKLENFLSKAAQYRSKIWV